MYRIKVLQGQFVVKTMILFCFLWCFQGLLYSQGVRIYNVNSSTGKLDSVGYDDANKTIILYRNAMNKSMSQVLNYKIEPSDVKIEGNYKSGSLFDFSKFPDQTIKIPLVFNKDGKKEKVEYKIKLHLGYRSIKTIMDGSNTHPNYASTGTGKDVEFKMAMDGDKIYILAMKYAGAVGGISTYDLQNSDYDVYVYDILNKAGKPIKLNTDGKKIIDILSINDKLYAIAQVSTSATETGKSGNSSYQIYRWENLSEGSKPVAISLPSKAVSYNLLFTGREEGDNIVFYGVRGNVSTGTSQVDQYSIPKTSSGNTVIQYKKSNNWTPSDVSLGLYSAGYASYADMPGVFGIISSTGSGNAIGNDFNNTGGITPKAFARVADGGNRLPLAGGNIEMVGNRYYFPIGYLLGSTSSSQGMYLLDFGTEPKEKIELIQNDPQKGNTSSAKNTFYDLSIYKETFKGAEGNLFSVSGNGSNRGNIRTYKLPNGKLRIAILLAEYGFKVWEME